MTLYYKIGSDDYPTDIVVHDSQPTGFYDDVAIATLKTVKYPASFRTEQNLRPGMHQTLTFNYPGNSGPVPKCTK